MKISLRPFLSKAQIEKRLQEMAKEISRDYQDKDLVLLMVLKGSICLTADLMRKLTISFILETIQCSSYSSGVEREELKVFGLEKLNVENKDVLIIDDIFDSGTTMTYLEKALKEKKARSIEGLVLLNKKIPRKEKCFLPKYTLFEMGQDFVVGYGVDYKEAYRGLEDIYTIEA